MSHFTSFAVAGGSGMLGSAIVSALVAAGAAKVVVLSRTAEAKVPAGVEVRVVDYESAETVQKALEGVEVVINALSSKAGALEVGLAQAASK